MSEENNTQKLEKLFPGWANMSLDERLEAIAREAAKRAARGRPVPVIDLRNGRVSYLGEREG